MTGKEPTYRDLDIMLREVANSGADRPALEDDTCKLTWSEFDARVNRIANALISSGINPEDRVAILARNSVAYATLMFGIQRAGACIVPLSSLAAAESLVGMTNDSGAKLIFVSHDYADIVLPHIDIFTTLLPEGVMYLDDNEDVSPDGHATLGSFILNASTEAPKLTLNAASDFNLIYTSGTTGTPKGIMHDRHFRSQSSIDFATQYGMGKNSRTLVSTPLYSNTTQVPFFSIMAAGGSAVIMEKFNTQRYLELSQNHQITHSVLVPVQFTRLLKEENFDGYDLSSYQAKFTTSAPLQSDVKREILKRWPAGGLTEFYGMTEGGGVTILEAYEFPGKLDTVGKVAEGTEIRVISEDGIEMPAGQAGELVGWSPLMMVGYHNRPEANAEASWHDDEGRRFHRSGDVGWFDEDGFLHLLDRKKDMIISGGINIYAVDLEQELLKHSEIEDTAVIGVPSEAWGETPLAFVVPNDPTTFDKEAMRQTVNKSLGKAQRISEICVIDKLPRSPIGKILKRELRSALIKD